MQSAAITQGEAIKLFKLWMGTGQCITTNWCPLCVKATMMTTFQEITIILLRRGRKGGRQGKREGGNIFS